MKRIIFGTTNRAKREQIQMALAGSDIKIVGIDPTIPLPKIPEDQETAQANAHQKAIAYAKAIGQPVLSMDVALFFDGVPKNEQPGAHVRHFNGRKDRPTDAESIEYYTRWINRLGGSITGKWDFAFCLASPSGEHCEAHAFTPKRFFTSKLSPVIIPGYPLESMQIDPETKKYISEMTPQEMARYWQQSVRPILEPLIDHCPFL